MINEGHNIRDKKGNKYCQVYVEKIHNNRKE